MFICKDARNFLKRMVFKLKEHCITYADKDQAFVVVGNEMMEHLMAFIKSASKLSNSVARETKLKTFKT